MGVDAAKRSNDVPPSRRQIATQAALWASVRPDG